MQKKVEEMIVSAGLLDGIKQITVALSGGADSVALLHVMRKISPRYGFTLSAAHLNHGIRGEEAGRDEAFVIQLCKKWDIPLVHERADVPFLAKRQGISIELASRQSRYDFLSRVSTGAVATAHTASDNLETILLNLTRGTAIKGLCGIPAKRDIFIRPLLTCTRAEVEEYCEKHALSYVTDSTNLSDDYTRNLLRHRVVPVLKQINPSVESAASRMAETLYEDYQLLDAAADTLLKSAGDEDGTLLTKKILKAKPSAAKRAIHTFLKSACDGAPPGYRHVSAVYTLCRGGGCVHLPGDREAVVQNGRLSVSIRDSFPICESFLVEISETVNDLFTKEQKINNLLLKNSLDCDKIVGQLIIRVRQPGDKMQLQNRCGTKSLKKIYNECHIPLENRQNLPVIADEEGVIWICGVGAAQRCAVTKGSVRILRIHVKK